MNDSILKKITSVSDSIFKIFDKNNISLDEAIMISDIIYKTALSEMNIPESKKENSSGEIYFIGDNHGWGLDPSLLIEEH